LHIPSTSPADPTDLADPADRRGYLVLGLLMLATWALAHRYLGLFHDAGLYALQALARLHPPLAADVFLAFESQDRFTLWSPLYAAAISLWGVEPAAAILTLSSQLALLLSAWVLARSVLPPLMALLGVGVLIAIPGVYGADQIFTCIESFLTPRMIAEAWVLGGVSAALRGKPAWAALCLLAAAAMHPLMAMAGFGALFCLYVAESRPIVALALVIVSIKALSLLAYGMPIGPWGRFDGQWLALVEVRSPYLFLRHWSLTDWTRVAVSLTTLGAGFLAMPPGRARTLAKITALTSVAGLAFTGISADGLHLVLMTQLQPWRCQWLAIVVAALLLPQTLLTLWRANTAGRAAAWLLVSTWLFAPSPYALTAAAGAVLAWVGAPRLKPNEARWIDYGAVGFALLAGLWRFGSNLQFTEAHYLSPSLPLWLRDFMSLTHDGSLPIILMLLAAWLARHRPALTRHSWAALGLAALGLAGLAGCTILAPQTWRAWTARDFPPTLAAQFANWRQLIPPRATVLWPESPLGVWLLLDRQSFLSVLQTSGMVFSEAGAREFARRAAAVAAAFNPAVFLDFGAGTGLSATRDQLRAACASRAFDYLVTGTDLGAEPISVPVPTSGMNRLELYRCNP
jgi:hypothetical protein